jgi:hypothetical protein
MTNLARLPLVLRIKRFLGEARKARYPHVTVAVFVISLVVFALIASQDIRTDIQLHTEAILGMLNGTHMIPVNFVYYFSVSALALFQNNMNALLAATVFLLSLAVTLKFLLTRRIIGGYLTASCSHLSQPERLIVAASFLLAFAFSLPATNILQGEFYLGQKPPNVWHNSTTIFMMPFALALFWSSYRQLVDDQDKGIAVIAGLVTANVLVKPHFVWVFAMVYPLLLMSRMGLKKRFWLNLLPVVWGAIPLGALFLQRANAVEGGLSISPFLVWSQSSSNIPVSVIASSFFPIVYLLFYWRELRRSLLLRYAVLCYLGGVALFVVLTETGPAQFHGNLGWQVIVCNYILFTTVTVLLAEKFTLSGRLEKKDKTIILALLLHVVSGFAYLVKMLATGSYQ